MSTPTYAPPLTPVQVAVRMPKWARRLPTPQQLERFHAKWEPDESGCRIWNGTVHPGGYGLFTVNGQSARAHRWIFWAMHGSLPPMVMHKCDNPLCVNWEGCLLPGTAADNARDMWSKGRASVGNNTKIPASQLEAIRAASARGVSYRLLAEQYGVSKSTIYWIVKGVRS